MSHSSVHGKNARRIPAYEEAEDGPRFGLQGRAPARRGRHRHPGQGRKALLFRSRHGWRDCPAETEPHFPARRTRQARPDRFSAKAPQSGHRDRERDQGMDEAPAGHPAERGALSAETDGEGRSGEGRRDISSAKALEDLGAGSGNDREPRGEVSVPAVAVALPPAGQSGLYDLAQHVSENRAVGPAERPSYLDLIICRGAVQMPYRVRRGVSSGCVRMSLGSSGCIAIVRNH
jgi:hypothetical protein